jgi:hypothetical protein
MNMNKVDFENQLRFVADYVFSYGLKKLKKDKESLQETLSRVGYKKMQEEDFRGFAKAQEIIIKYLLNIEKELISVRKEKEKISKGKHKKELRQNANFIKTTEEEEELIIQRAAFKGIANSIAWILFTNNRGYIRRLINPNSEKGYLRDKNWKSVARVVREINKKEGVFALISDITSVVGIGDILVYKSGNIKLIEVKEGKINQQIASLCANPNLKKENKHFEEQTARQARQLKRMGQFVEIYSTDHGTDPFSKKQINITEAESVVHGSVTHAVSNIIKDFPFTLESSSSSILLSSDCCLIGVTKLKNTSEFVRKANFQHELYHLEQSPWENCDYLSENNAKNYQNLDKREPQVYLSTSVHSLRDNILRPALCPLYLLISTEAAIKIISGETSVFLKFYPERFRKICEEMNFKTRWIKEKELNSYFDIGSNKFDKTNLIKFSNGYLELKFNNGKTILSLSFFNSIVYELESGYNIAYKIKKLLSTNKTTLTQA